MIKIAHARGAAKTFANIASLEYYVQLIKPTISNTNAKFGKTFHDRCKDDANMTGLILLLIFQERIEMQTMATGNVPL